MFPIFKDALVTKIPNNPKNEKWQISKDSLAEGGVKPLNQQGGDQVMDGEFKPKFSSKVSECSQADGAR